MLGCKRVGTDDENQPHIIVSITMTGENEIARRKRNKTNKEHKNETTLLEVRIRGIEPRAAAINSEEI